MWLEKPITGRSLSDRRLVLSFDDGPGTQTLELAEYLAEEKIQAVFFVVGKHVRILPDSIIRLLELGHAVGNHTENHLHLTSCAVSDPEAVAEFALTDHALTELGVPSPRVFRPPYGGWNPHLAHLFNQNARREVGPLNWDIYGHDHACWRDRRSPELCSQAYLTAIGKAKRGLVLFHDSCADDPAIAARNQACALLRLLIPRLRDQGYSFGALNEIPELAQSGNVGFL